MVKRIVVAGSRDYENYEEAREYIDFCISGIREAYSLIFVSGSCKGADRIGERYAAENHFPIEIYRAEWDKYGKAAGPKRNAKMAEVCDYVICFWDGKSKGTKSMVDCAVKMGKPVKIKRI